MALLFSATVKDARNDAIQTAVGASAVLKIRTGAAPALITDADSGTVLATLTLPTTWMASSSGGVVAKTGTWEDTSADAGGVAAHFRLYASGGSTQHLQGTITSVGGGGDMELTTTTLVATEPFEIATFSITDGN